MVRGEGQGRWGQRLMAAVRDFQPSACNNNHSTEPISDDGLEDATALSRPLLPLLPLLSLLSLLPQLLSQHSVQRDEMRRDETRARLVGEGMRNPNPRCFVATVQHDGYDEVRSWVLVVFLVFCFLFLFYCFADLFIFCFVCCLGDSHKQRQPRRESLTCITYITHHLYICGRQATLRLCRRHCDAALQCAAPR